MATTNVVDSCSPQFPAFSVMQLLNVNVLDSKHAGILILKVGAMTDPAQVRGVM